MLRSFLILSATILFASCASTSTFYVVRHAEKEAANANMTSDVPLSAAGKERAEALKEVLSNKNISRIYSTKFQRTIGTASPIGMPIQAYNPGDTSFIRSLRELNENVLIVGHSNTVDDIVNGLMGSQQLSDLPESQYGDLFIVRKKGKKWKLKKSRFGN